MMIAILGSTCQCRSGCPSSDSAPMAWAQQVRRGAAARGLDPPWPESGATHPDAAEAFRLGAWRVGFTPCIAEQINRAMSSIPVATATIPFAATSRLVRELRALLVLAFPLVLTQLTQVLVHTTEVLMLGRLGPSSLAAATLAAALFHTGMMFAIGVASATAPLIAQAKGARQPRRIRHVVRQGLWVTLAITVPLMLALWFARPVLTAMGQEPSLLAMTEAYMRPALWGLPFSVGFIVLRSFAAAFGHARAILA